MELNWIWQSILIFYVGTFILRIGGRKSISQMTISQTVVMIGLGSLLIQPVSGKGLFVTFAVGLLLSLLMILSEYLAVKVDFLETIFSGKAVIVIQNGQPILKNLRSLRLSIDKLETRLRQAGISSLEDVQYATLEVSGQLGYELKESKKPVTKEDFQVLMAELAHIKNALGCTMKTPIANQALQNNIFSELRTKKFEGNKNEP